MGANCVLKFDSFVFVQFDLLIEVNVASFIVRYLIFQFFDCIHTFNLRADGRTFLKDGRKICTQIVNVWESHDENVSVPNL